MGYAMEDQYITPLELSAITEIIDTLGYMSDEARMMIGNFDLYDVNGEKLCSICYRGDEFVVILNEAD